MSFIIALLALAVPNCQFEDSTNCVYIAADHGNGVGRDFLDIDGTAYYLPQP